MIYEAVAKNMIRFSSKAAGKNQDEILSNFNLSYLPRTCGYNLFNSSYNIIFLNDESDTNGWVNELSDNGLILYESNKDDPTAIYTTQGKFKNRVEYRITFMKDLTTKGSYKKYAFVGVFLFDSTYDCHDNRLKYNRIQNKIDTVQLLKNFDENNTNKTILDYLYPLYLNDVNYRIRFKIKDQLCDSIAINNTSLNNKIKNILKSANITSLYDILFISMSQIYFLLINNNYFIELINYIKERLIIITDKNELQLLINNEIDIQKSIIAINTRAQLKEDITKDHLQEINFDTISKIDNNNVSLDISDPTYKKENKELNITMQDEPNKNNEISYNKFYNEIELKTFKNDLYGKIDADHYEFLIKILDYINYLENKLTE